METKQKIKYFENSNHFNTNRQNNKAVQKKTNSLCMMSLTPNKEAFAEIEKEYK